MVCGSRGVTNDAGRTFWGVDALRGTGSHALLSRLMLRRAASAAVVPAGQRSESVAAIREVLAALRAQGWDWSAATGAHAAGVLLGPADPDGRRLLEDARERFAALGARPFVAQVDALFAPAPAASAPPAGAASRTTNTGG